MARIYTMTGDDGTTGLLGGKRVPKSDLRVDASGTVDELNAVIGAARCRLGTPLVDAVLARVQDELFTLGANLALPDGADAERWGIPAIRDEDVRALEREIDAAEARLEPIRQFILPGGSPAAAALHLARAVARRAERCCVALAAAEKVDPRILRYLNRLSDLCFVLARALNRADGVAEAHPTFSER